MIRRTNFIVTGVLLLGVFALALWIVSVRIDMTANRMLRSMTREVGHYRADLIDRDFRRTEQLALNAWKVVKEWKKSPEELSEFFVRTLGLDAKVERIWMIVPGKEAVCFDSSGLCPTSPEQLRERKRLADPLTGNGGGLYKDRGELYWTVCRNAGGMALGFDISLSGLHQYYAGMSPSVRSYAYILNKEGVVIAHPDERFIGVSILPDSSGQHGDRVQDSVFTAFSTFLSLPVERVYYPIKVGGEEWIVAVNVPQLLNQDEMNDFHRWALVVAALTVMVFVVLLLFAWRKWRKENELRRVAEQEALQLNLQQLRNQLNPHFLFNSLNSLKALIGTDASLARKFVLELSKVYRYVLEKRNDSLATVEDELNFTRHYYFLQKIRFGEQVQLEIVPGTELAAGRIPAMSVQMLIENALKHNEITYQHPLLIRIYLSADMLVVENSGNPRSEASPDSMGIGIESIRKIYGYYSDRCPECHQEERRFICRLPLIPMTGQ